VTIVSYVYDALGQRIDKYSTTSAVYFAYDESGHLLGEYDSGGNLIEETVWLGDLPIATVQPNGSGGVTVFYIHADHLNTPKAITLAATNGVVWRWDQDPFGTLPPNQNPSNVGTFVYNLRFPGQYYDVETGLNYNMARDYDPATGRYVESDPVGLGGGVNTYSYVRGMPIQLSDQFGLMACGDWGWMAIDWALGTGSRNRTYGPESDQAQQIAQLPPVDGARQLYRQKNSAAKGSCCDASKLQPVTNYAAKFGFRQFMTATFTSCAWSFVGSFRIDIYPLSCTKARFVVTNNSSFTSFAYGIGPSWTHGPGSNFLQTYTWDETL
jgi:RHS repeat-associated protein